MPPKSQPGEGIVIVVDVGPGVRASTENTFYSQAKSCLINILQRKIFAEKSKDMVGIVLFNTDETNNKLAKDDEYQHITVYSPPKFVDWDMISKAKNLPRGNSNGDWLDAVIVAMDLLYDHERIMYGSKKIVLMTDFNGEFSDDQTETIIKGVKSMGIELSVIGPCLDDDDDDSETENGNRDVAGPSSAKNKKSKSAPLNWNGKPKSQRQLAAETLIKRIICEVDGIICSFEEAIPQLIFFEKKSQRSANWNSMLDIGENFKIPIVGRIKIRRATLPSWKKVYIEDENAVVITETSYHKKDENQTVVEKEDVISGFKYGTTLVPFGEEDSTLKYSCNVGASISVLGFTRSSFVPMTMRVGDQVLVITAKDGDDDGAIALSALIQALKELDMVAITRKVYRKNSNPVLGALYPDITSDYECLIWIGLPFEEEYRDFSFPSLERVTKNITQEQFDAMDELISAMDVSNKEDDDDDEELLDPTQVVNPQIQHFYNCLTHRAIFPKEALPAPQQHVLDILSPPEKQREARDKINDKLKELFPTKLIKDYKMKKQDIFDSTPTTTSTTSTSASGTVLTSSDLTRVTIKNISSATPVQDFMAMLSGERPDYPNICTMMTDVLFQMVESLTGDRESDRILSTKLIEAIKTYRKETCIIDPSPFNDFITYLKQVAKARGFSNIWTVIVDEKLGLIAKSESVKSNFTSEESEKFYQLEEEKKEQPMEVNDEGDYDDMLDDL